ncbi:hypothetical protein [Burkholderia vietnamiensis]|uniref:hypothetical protein n=1 Tax=Burkholderia vietnamiensis TaxID=60552 RepID=UPI00158A533A|nr:hypothetical protein [Burkholderia vietnamiensis]
MKERPILFSGPMVRAIIEGRKTQTRRVMKPRRDLTVGCKLACCELAGEVNTGHYSNSEFGAPGDRLWVRETHDVNRLGSETFPDGRTRLYAGIAYQADDGRHEADISDSQCRAIEAKTWRGWTPSIHMPRWASRITLEITGVRAERLQSIEWDEAIAEGIRDPRRAARRVDPVEGTVAQFRQLWDGLNAARGHGWDANPWVWVIEFRRIDGPEKR